MTMSLVGTLICPTDVVQGTGEIVMEEKSLINVGVSLEEGLRLWGKDAGLGKWAFTPSPFVTFGSCA